MREGGTRTAEADTAVAAGTAEEADMPAVPVDAAAEAPEAAVARPQPGPVAALARVAARPVQGAQPRPSRRNRDNRCKRGALLGRTADRST